MRRFAITGPGHCGTTYAARLVSALGAPCGHETVFDFHRDQSGIEQRWAGFDGDSALQAVAYLDRLPPGSPVLYVCRFRDALLRSFLRWPYFADVCACHATGEHRRAPFAKFVADECPGLFDLPTEVQRADAWITRHYELVERRCQAFGLPLAVCGLDHLTEPDLIPGIVEHLGIDCTVGSSRVIVRALTDHGFPNEHHHTPRPDLDPDVVVAEFLETA